eukprot:scaffold93029_cov29-Tisochrysis_lutea.AAC.1
MHVPFLSTSLVAEHSKKARRFCAASTSFIPRLLPHVAGHPRRLVIAPCIDGPKAVAARPPACARGHRRQWRAPSRSSHSKLPRRSHHLSSCLDLAFVSAGHSKHPWPHRTQSRGPACRHMRPHAHPRPRWLWLEGRSIPLLQGHRRTLHR